MTLYATTGGIIIKLKVTFSKGAYRANLPQEDALFLYILGANLPTRGNKLGCFKSQSLLDLKTKIESV